MKFILSCSSCIVKQVSQVTDILGLDENKSKMILRKVLGNLAISDYEKSTPELMGETWDLIEREIGFRDVYESVKIKLDKELLSQTHIFYDLIQKHQDSYARFEKALLFAICGNLIDFAATDSFNPNTFIEKVRHFEKQPYGIDDRRKLFEKLKNAKSILYLGDNCGEIVLDKIFIKVIKEIFPTINVIYAVKGFAVLNDITQIDAKIVGMNEVAEVVSNGSKGAGTVLETASKEFNELFEKASLIISKGQGNFESLHPYSKDKIFYLMMAKCPAIANVLEVNPMSLICAHSENWLNQQKTAH